MEILYENKKNGDRLSMSSYKKNCVFTISCDGQGFTCSVNKMELLKAIGGKRLRFY